MNRNTLAALLTAASILTMGAAYAADEMAKPKEPAKAEVAKPAKKLKKHHVVKRHAVKRHVAKHHVVKHHAVKHHVVKHHAKKAEVKKDVGAMAPAN